ncbi:ribose ABC transporter permease [Vibrio sp.]|nr:ribose ABC transporter permease [Vibrio sp.]
MNTMTNVHGDEHKKVTTFKQKLTKWSRHPAFYPLIGFLTVFLVMMLYNDNFLTANNLSNVARQVSINAILAVGMTCAILLGGIDLSVGPVMALSGTVSAGMMVAGLPPSLSILIGLFIGLCFGAANGIMIAYARMPAFIVTLASLGIARGIALIYTGGYPISGLPDSFSFWGRGSFLGLQTPILMMILVYVVFYIVLNHTPFGRYIYAIGGNEEASRLSGIKVPIVIVLVYTISGFTASIAGIILTSRLMSGQPNAGVGFELDAIAAVVIGGTAMSGGKGAILGTLIGAMLLGVLNNGLNLAGVSPYVQNVIKGIIILVAIYIGTSKRK